MASMRGHPSRVPRSISSRRHVVTLGALAVTFVVLGSSAACGPEAVGVEACRKIEQVRCESAQACGIDLSQPVHSGDKPENNVAACIRYYDDQCRHGLVTSVEPGAHAVDECVNAIINGDCSIVEAPETHEACKFLVPPSKTPPPATDAASDASTD
jgi:hypothetical protein